MTGTPSLHPHAKGSVECPALTEALDNQVARSAKANGGLCHRDLLTFEGDEAGLSRVSLLLSFRRPIAIFGRVGAIVIAALQGRSGWTLPHIGKKGFEAVSPSVANHNPSTAISMKVRSSGIVASPSHVGPNAKLSGFCSSVRGVCRLKGRQSHAAMGAFMATRCAPVYQVVRQHIANGPAIAFARHFAPIVRNDGPSAVSPRNGIAFSMFHSSILHRHT
jgi:hypothetical protein